MTMVGMLPKRFFEVICILVVRSIRQEGCMEKHKIDEI